MLWATFVPNASFPQPKKTNFHFQSSFLRLAGLLEGISFHRVSSTPGTVQYVLRNWQGGGILALLDVSAAFDTGSFDPVESVVHFVRNIGFCVRLVTILHRRSYTDGSLRWFGLKACSVAIWNCPGISTGPDLVLPVRSRCSETFGIARFSNPSLCRRHPVSRFMQVDRCCSTSSPCYARHWGREGLDVVEPAQTERRQDIVYLARNKPLPGRSSDPLHTHKMRSTIGSLLWSWITHGAPGEQALPSLLLSSATLRTVHRSLTKESLLTLARARLHHKPNRSL